MSWKRQFEMRKRRSRAEDYSKHKRNQNKKDEWVGRKPNHSDGYDDSGEYGYYGRGF